MITGNNKKRIYVFAIIFLVIIIGVMIIPAFIVPTTPAPIALTESRLLALDVAFKQYYNDYGVFPKGNISEVMNKLHPKKTLFINGKCNMYLDFEAPRKTILGKYRTFPAFDSNAIFLDAWGVPIQIIEQNDYIISYSFGRNKIDEKQKGDDIIHIIKIKDDKQPAPLPAPDDQSSPK